MQQFPVRARVELVNFRKYLYPMTFLPALLITMQGTLTLLGEEKEKGIKDAMSLKGMSRAAYWISWLVSQGLGMTISCFVVAVAARALGIIEHTGMVHFGVMLWLYGCWLVTFAFLISACLKTIKAMFVVALILLIVIGPIVYVVEFLFIRLDVSYIFILSTFMFAPVPYGHLLFILSDGELKGVGWEEGLTTANWPQSHDFYYEAHIFLFVDIFVCLGLAWLVDWMVSDHPLSFGRGPPCEPGGDLEMADSARAGGIAIQGLSKRFTYTEKQGCRAVKKHVQAVDNLELEVPPNSIFCLLGSNGAGKSTTGALLTGLLAPDSGTALVGGFDVVRDRERMRRSMGMCPQHDILYNDLTALELLLLYGGMMGLSDAEGAAEAARLLEAVDLQGKAADLARQMSGGQRRRLSLAASLIGRPAVCFLDEPTTGLDPHNRQRVWALMQEVKFDSTVLLVRACSAPSPFSTQTVPWPF